MIVAALQSWERLPEVGLDRRSALAKVVVLFIVIVCVCLLSSCYKGSRPPRVGKPALDFTIQDGERKVSLRDFRGQVLILNFWASWCPPCIAETPSLVRLEKQLAGKGVVVLGVSADEDEAAYHAFLKKYDITFLTVRDPSVKVQHEYGTKLIPESYVIDSQGVLRRKIVNAIDWQSPEITTFLTRVAADRRN